MGERVAIVGSRDFKNLEAVREWVNKLPPETVIVSGGARGVDRTAADAARQRGLAVMEFLADWNKHGKRAGFIRNQLIVENCDRVIAFWDYQSRGTNDTIRKARAAGLAVLVIGDKE